MPLVSPTHQLQSTECLKVMLSLLSVLWCCWLGGRKGKTEWWGTGMVIYLERGANLHMAQLMPLPLTVSCFSEIQTGFTFLVPAHPGIPWQRAIKRVCVCVCNIEIQDIPGVLNTDRCIYEMCTWQNLLDVVHKLLQCNAYIDVRDLEGDTALVKVQHVNVLLNDQFPVPPVPLREV